MQSITIWRLPLRSVSPIEYTGGDGHRQRAPHVRGRHRRHCPGPTRAGRLGLGGS